MEQNFVLCQDWRMVFIVTASPQKCRIFVQNS